MTTVQLNVVASYYSHMEIHTSTVNTDISLSREFQDIFQAQHGNMACSVTVRIENVPENRGELGMSIMSTTEKMFHTHW